jgi:hypothetical protein
MDLDRDVPPEACLVFIRREHFRRVMVYTRGVFRRNAATGWRQTGSRPTRQNAQEVYPMLILSIRFAQN